MKRRKWLLKAGSIPYKGLYNLLNLWIPKENRAVVISNAKAEDNAIEMANFLAAHFEGKVDILLPEEEIAGMKQFLDPRINVYKCPRHMALNWTDFKHINRGRYIFLTYQFLYGKANPEQKYINLWHGLTYKKIQSLRPYDGIPAQADYTISGSEMTRRMNAEIFNVPEDSVWVTGLPRNDLMLRTMDHVSTLKSSITPDFNRYAKVIIWMPTYRRTDESGSIEVAADRNKIYGSGHFAMADFNDLLRRNNTLCLVKTHHILHAPRQEENYSNILEINDAWLAEQGILLYQLLACTDALISDYSSVMIDYMLLDRPVFCLAADIENYKKTQGLCFSDYEDWIPSKLYTEQQDFLADLSDFLADDKDDGRGKRQRLLPKFFTYKDTKSARRILDYTLRLR